MQQNFNGGAQIEHCWLQSVELVCLSISGKRLGLLGN